jgi:hypothetical protein
MEIIEKTIDGVTKKFLLINNSEYEFYYVDSTPYIIYNGESRELTEINGKLKICSFTSKLTDISGITEEMFNKYRDYQRADCLQNAFGDETSKALGLTFEEYAIIRNNYLKLNEKYPYWVDLD